MLMCHAMNAIATGISCRWFPVFEWEMPIGTDFLHRQASGPCIAIVGIDISKSCFTYLSTKAVTWLTTLGKEKAKR
jgi:hypothetical protein